MESELSHLCQQANAINLNYIVAKTANEDLQRLDEMVSQLESRVSQIRANLEEEANILDIAHNAVQQILAKVKNKPLPSALKGVRYGVPTNAFSTPSKATPGKKAVSFDIKSSPLSLCQAVGGLGLPESGQSTCITKLSQTEFDSIPKYMKGRLTVDKISGMIDALNQIYSDKYAIMNQNPSKLPHEHRQKFWDWKEMYCDEVQDRYFITEADIKAAMQNSASKPSSGVVFKLDPIGRGILAILRHFGRIREVRTPGIVRFVIL